jgi:transposase
MGLPELSNFGCLPGRAGGSLFVLGLHESQLYGWRTKARAAQDRSGVEQRQALEIARLKRPLAEQAEELAIVKKAATYFAKSLK